MDPQVVAALVAAVLGGVTSTLTATIQVVRSRQALVRKQHEASEERFQAVLRTGDPVQITRYLDEVIGRFTLAEYASGNAVEAKINRYIDQIVSYVGTDAEVDAEAAALQDEGPPEPKVPSSVADQFDFGDQYVTEDLATGVFLLRRDIERALADLIAEDGVRVQPPGSASVLLRVASELGLLHPAVLDDLKYVVRVTNQVIHGQPVTRTIASEIGFLGARAMEAMRRDMGPQVDDPYSFIELNA